MRSAGTSERQLQSMGRRSSRLPFPGMDPINERKVFMQLVEAACRWGLAAPLGQRSMLCWLGFVQFYGSALLSFV